MSYRNGQVGMLYAVTSKAAVDLDLNGNDKASSISSLASELKKTVKNPQARLALGAMIYATRKVGLPQFQGTIEKIDPLPKDLPGDIGPEICPVYLVIERGKQGTAA